MLVIQFTKWCFYVLIATVLLLIGFGNVSIAPAQETTASSLLDAEEEFVEEPSFFLDAESFDSLDDEDADFEPEVELAPKSLSLFSRFRAGSRFTYRHELSYNFQKAYIVTNRLSLRLEWSQFFGGRYYLFVDGKTTLFASNDHLTKAEDNNYLWEGNLREAYLQISTGNLSAKIGKQVIIWGEADGAVITDVISPRDGSEFMFTTIEDARLGQFSVLADYYSSRGTWSLIVNPDPQTDITPKAETEYAIMSFDSEKFDVQEDAPDWNDTEYGFRWKHTIDKSDVAVMVANLVGNQAVFIDTGETPEGKTRLRQEYRRFSMIGFAGNLARDTVLWKGELACKLQQPFQRRDQDERYVAIKRDTIDIALGFEYSANAAYTLTLETSWQHIGNWDESIQGERKDTNAIAMSWNKTFLHDTLDLQYIISYAFMDKAAIHQIRSRYDFTDQLNGRVDALYFDISEKDNPFRNKSRITAKLEYQL